MNSPNPICHLHWVSVPFSHSQLTVYILTSFLQSIFQDGYSLPYHFFFRDLFFSVTLSESKVCLTQDWQSFCMMSECFIKQQSLSQSTSVSPLCLTVSLVSQVRQCAPLTWSIWRRCLMGGSRSRNHPSLSGHLFQMKSSRSQGADGCNQFMQLCSGCYWRTMKRKQYYEQRLFKLAMILP